MKIYFIFSIMIALRLVELLIANKNEKQIIELHKAKLLKPHEHYYIYLFHVLWFLSLFIESFYKHKIHTGYIGLICYIMLAIAQVIRFESMQSLGIYWTAKIYQSENQKINYDGIYKWFAHPSYFAVVLEFFFLPYLFYAYYTLWIFFPINLILIANRIKLEQKITGRFLL